MHLEKEFFAGLDCLGHREPGDTGICPSEKERDGADGGSEPHAWLRRSAFVRLDSMQKYIELQYKFS